MFKQLSIESEASNKMNFEQLSNKVSYVFTLNSSPMDFLFLFSFSFSFPYGLVKDRFEYKKIKIRPNL